MGRFRRFLTASRFMRNLYGAAKVAAFVLLGIDATPQRHRRSSHPNIDSFRRRAIRPWAGGFVAGL